MLWLYFIIQVFYKNYNVLWVGGILIRFIHDADTELGEPVRRNKRVGDNFDWLGDHFANQEAPEVSLRGSWMLCTPFPTRSLYKIKLMSCVEKIWTWIHRGLWWEGGGRGTPLNLLTGQSRPYIVPTWPRPHIHINSTWPPPIPYPSPWIYNL